MKKIKRGIDFKKLTPKMQIGKVKFSGLYEKSLLKHGNKEESDFSRNTTTWD